MTEMGKQEEAMKLQNAMIKQEKKRLEADIKRKVQKSLLQAVLFFNFGPP